MRRFLALAAGAAAVLALGAELHGYVLSGSVWGAQQVKYYINPQNIYMTDAEASAAIQSAASNWSTQSAANIQLVNAGFTSANVVGPDNQSNVFFRNDSGASGAAAETYRWTDGRGKIIDADIVIHEADYMWFTGTTSCWGSGLYIEDVLTHEFGHALGLMHSTVGTATMYPSGGFCTEELRSLDPDDIAGVETMYPPRTTTGSAPAAPSQLTATANSLNPSTSLNLAWVDNATDASGYNVERSTDGSSFATVAQLGSSATSYVDGGLSSGAVYYYRVKAYNSSGSSYSNMATAQTQAAASVTQPPAVPSAPSPTDGTTNLNPNNVTLSWAASAGAQAYDVYFGTTITPGLYQSNITGTSVRAPAMSAGTTYYWMVIAKNSVGSTASAPWRFTTKATGRK